LGYSNGHRLIEAIREHNVEYRGLTPTIAVTEIGEDGKQAIEAGFNAYITKPFSQADIVSAVTQVWRDSSDLAA
jgi:CheY-like chemotaxis protein